MKQISNIFSLCFIIFWMAFVFLDYWQKQPVYYHSFHLFQYWGLAAFLLALGAGVIWAVKKHPSKPWFSGLSVVFLSLLISVVSSGFAYSKLVEDDSFSAAKAGHFILLLGGTTLAIFLILAVSHVLGSFICKSLSVKLVKGDEAIVRLATGTMGLVLILFILGAFSLLYSFLIFPVLGLLLILGRKEALQFAKKILWQPIQLNKNLKWYGIGSFYLLIVVWSINFAAVNVPMPIGFDSMTLYANLPSLIGQHHSLVEGYQPYNWSLFMSLGQVLFNSIPISLALSYLGGPLSVFALYLLCRNWLKLDVNKALLCVLLFSITPAITIQAFGELKVDLGLLFVYLSTLLVLLNYFKTLQDNKNQALNNLHSKQWFNPEILLAGLMSGFGLGIKLTTVYFIFALLCALWYVHHQKRGFFAAFLLCLFAVFILKIDDFAGLRKFHLGVGYLQWGALLAAIFLLAGLLKENKEAMLKSIRLSVTYSLFLILPFLPWMIKNHLETKSFSPIHLLNGKAATPAVNIQLMENRLQNPNQ